MRVDPDIRAVTGKRKGQAIAWPFMISELRYNYFAGAAFAGAAGGAAGGADPPETLISISPVSFFSSSPSCAGGLNVGRYL